MSARQDQLIEQQQNYLDFCLAEEPYRRVIVSDKANARAELAQLRASIAQAETERDEQREAARLSFKHRKQVEADLQAAQERIEEQARQLAEAREIISMTAHEWTPAKRARAWLAANPAPQPEHIP